MNKVVQRPAVSEDLKVVWHALTETEVLAKLESPARTGLNAAQVDERRLKYGSNELADKPRQTFFEMLVGQLNDFIVILLIIAALVSVMLGDWVEASAILAIVVLNAVLGIIQENRAEQALAALKKLAAPEAQVLREGRRITIPASQLVPGDMVYLEAGNFVPADIRLLEAVNLRVEEAALTGESVAVEKVACGRLESNIPIGDRKNTAFMGTTVNYGRGRGVVVSTGMLTQLGLIAGMLQRVDEEATPLQQRLEHLGRLLGYGALSICGLVFLAGMLRASVINVETITVMFMIAVSLAIAAVPEGLPAVVTISLAMGMHEMIRRNALIRKLASVETLGSATVICSDKTGTLTQNEMTVTRIWIDGQEFHITGSGYATRGEFLRNGQPVDLRQYPGLLSALWVGVLNNDALLEADNGSNGYCMVGDPTEGSLLVAAAKANIFASDLSDCFPREEEIPFDSTRKRMLTVHDILQVDAADVSPIYDPSLHRWHVIAVKGAPDVVLGLCNRYDALDDRVKALDDQMRQKILAANDTMTGDALRVLGLAYRLLPVLPEQIRHEELERDLIFVGLAGMIDPARPEVNPALEKARHAGIRTIMITGDYPNTARAIASSIGLLKSGQGQQVLTGMMLNEMDDAQLQQVVLHTDVFARVSPEHKLRIVDALRANHEVVAMTGDGVNDAPAIKRADIGIAMGISGTDVAKETADMVLTDDNYASIVSAIEQGRIIYSNIRKFVYYLLSCNMAEILIIFLATLITGQSPLAAIQLLWLNLVTDGAPAVALATEKGDPDIMKRPPRHTREPIINRFMTTGILIQTIAITAVTLAAYFIGRATQIQYAETMAFVTLSVSELLRAYTARSEYYPLLKTGIFTNKWMNYGVLTSLLLILVVIYAPVLNTIFHTLPLGWQQWLPILPLLVLPSLAAEVTKLLFSPASKAPLHPTRA